MLFRFLISVINSQRRIKSLEVAGKYPLALRSFLKNHARARIILKKPKIKIQSRRTKKKRLSRAMRSTTTKSLDKTIRLIRRHSAI
jgi:hypothetical protein